MTAFDSPSELAAAVNEPVSTTATKDWSRWSWSLVGDRQRFVDSMSTSAAFSSGKDRLRSTFMNNDSKTLDGQVAIVTGASKGIGAGIARSLAEAGAAVVVNYAGAKADADRVVAEITAKDGRAIAVQADVANEADVARLFAEAKKAFGQVTVLVNNAGRYAFGPLESVTVEEIRRQLDTNVTGVLLTTREAARALADGGSIVNIGSAASSIKSAGGALYTATKCAVDGITGVMARELAPRKIRVNSINPGPTATEGAAAMGISEDMVKAMVAQIPLGRMGQPADIGPIAVFLASPASAWVTGEVIVASGGLR
jgi:3-oxoacyl-[acyl-carrier protein] reductase